jgi:xylonate dehydratase
MSQNGGMGWAPGELGRDDIMIVSTLGGLRGADGTPTARSAHRPL